MMTVENGVRIPSDQFPITYKYRNRIRSMAVYCKQSPEDALQESMMFEYRITTNYQQFLLKKKPYKRDRVTGRLRKSKSDIENLLLQTVRFKLLSEAERYINRRNTLPEMDDGEYTGTFVKFSRKDLYYRLLLQEVVRIVRDHDEALYGLIRYKQSHWQMSWYEIYRAVYARNKSKTWFFNKLNEMRRICRDVRAEFARAHAIMNNETFRINLTGMVEDVNVFSNRKVHQLAS